MSKYGKFISLFKKFDVKSFELKINGYCHEIDRNLLAQMLLISKFEIAALYM